MYKGPAPKPANNTITITIQSRRTFWNPCRSVGSICFVQGTPPTFIPKAAPHQQHISENRKAKNWEVHMKTLLATHLWYKKWESQVKETHFQQLKAWKEEAKERLWVITSGLVRDWKHGRTPIHICEIAEKLHNNAFKVKWQEYMQSWPCECHSQGLRPSPSSQIAVQAAMTPHWLQELLMVGVERYTITHPKLQLYKYLHVA